MIKNYRLGHTQSHKEPGLGQQHSFLLPSKGLKPSPRGRSPHHGPAGRKIHAKLQRELKKQAFFAQYTCDLCHSNQNLEIHHLLPDPATTGSRKDVAILCKKCHQEIHRLKGRK